MIAIFRTTNGTLSPEDRAERAADRLRGLLRAGLDPGEIDVRSRGGSWAVFAGGGLLMIATPDEAGARHEDAETTARRWAANLKLALGSRAPRSARSRHPSARRNDGPSASRPWLRPWSPLAVPVGQSRVVPLRGTANGSISVRIEGNEAASARVAPGKAAVEVRGLQPGKAVVRVTREGKEAGFACLGQEVRGARGGDADRGSHRCHRSGLPGPPRRPAARAGVRASGTRSDGARDRPGPGGPGTSARSVDGGIVPHRDHRRVRLPRQGACENSW